MTTSEKLTLELTKVLSGQPWYGPSVYEILGRVTFESAYERTGHAHTIAELILHMVSWTEEVMDRLNEKPASLPVSGDWPHPGDPDENKWKMWIDDLKLVNVNLVKTIQDFPEDEWGEPMLKEIDDEPAVTYEELVYGLIQHHVYHSGQIALLVRAIIG
jgi:uncharacterized damage-inducible protein DinB